MQSSGSSFAFLMMLRVFFSENENRSQKNIVLTRLLIYLKVKIGVDLCLTKRLKLLCMSWHV